MIKRAVSLLAGVGLLSFGFVASFGVPARAQSFVPVNTPAVRIVVPTNGLPADSTPKPTGRGIGTVTHHASAGGQNGGNHMVYHGGPIMVGMKHLYYIWYGDWSKNTDAIQILQEFGLNIGGSPYFNINTSYHDDKGNQVENAVTLAASIFDHYSKGTNLTDSDIQDVVFNAIRSGQLPKDPMGVYFVLTSADVHQTYEWYSFCGSFCGWHYYGDLDGASIKYSFVGNPEQCPTSCSAQTVTPNGNLGADGMASVIAHELEEAATDPQIDAWYTNYGMENGDMCAWNFGKTEKLSNGARYNMTLGKRNYLIQQNWVNANPGYCAMSYH